MTATHTAREHPPIDAITKLSTEDLWAYALGELDFLSTPEQRRIPAGVTAAMHELHRRRRSRAK